MKIEGGLSKLMKLSTILNIDHRQQMLFILSQIEEKHVMASALKYICRKGSLIIELGSWVLFHYASNTVMQNYLKKKFLYVGIF